MSLNIKDPEAHRLAQELAELSGKSMTAVVTEALREKRARELKKQSKRMTVEEMMEIGKRIRSHIKGPIIDHAELLYDDKGLPK